MTPSGRSIGPWRKVVLFASQTLPMFNPSCQLDTVLRVQVLTCLYHGVSRPREIQENPLSHLKAYLPFYRSLQKPRIFDGEQIWILIMAFYGLYLPPKADGSQFSISNFPTYCIAEGRAMATCLPHLKT